MMAFLCGVSSCAAMDHSTLGYYKKCYALSGALSSRKAKAK